MASCYIKTFYGGYQTSNISGFIQNASHIINRFFN